MKRLIAYFISIVVLCIMSCEDSTTVFDPDSDVEYKKSQFSTLAGQFDYIWTGLNNSYVFWDTDSTDWDAIREEYFPKFKELDEIGQRGDSVKDEIIRSYITDIGLSLKDRHLVIYMTNPYKSLWPIIEMNSADNHMRMNDLGILLYFSNRLFKVNLFNNYSVGNIKEMSYDDGIRKHAYSCVINDSIPLIHIPNCYATNSNFCHQKPDFLQVVDNFFDNVRLLSAQNRLKGVIIDNRFNFGGRLEDLDTFVQTFCSKPVEMFRQRYKTGLGKYDYSPWVTYTIYPDTEKYVDIHDAPIIILQDIFSQSAGELLGHALSFMPNTHLIGEQTIGAQGALTEGGYGYFHAGSFNSDSIDFYLEKYGAAAGVKTASVCTELRNKVTGKYEQLESIGITPDEYLELDQDRFFSLSGDNQIDAAIEYINNNN